MKCQQLMSSTVVISFLMVERLWESVKALRWINLTSSLVRNVENIFLSTSKTNHNLNLLMMSFVGSCFYVSDVDNTSGDSGCIDELQLYGQPVDSSSIVDLPFASCAFNPVEFDSGMVRQTAGTTEWISATDNDAVVDCFVENSSHLNLTSLTIGVCDNGATDVELVIKMESDTGECQTAPHKRSYQSWYTEIMKGSQLGSCAEFDFNGRVRLSFIYSSSDQICIDKIIFNKVSK